MKFVMSKTAKEAAADRLIKDEAAYYAHMECMEQLFDAIDSGELSDKSEICLNVQAVKALIDMKDPALESYIYSQPELAKAYDSCESMEQFATVVEKTIQEQIAQEGFGKDLLWDGLISAIIHRKDATVEALEPAIQASIERVQGAKDENFAEWRALKQISVFSKYLPDQKEFAKCATALTNASNYLMKTKPDKFDPMAFRKFFVGTVYMKGNGKINTSTTNPGTEWSPILFLFTLVPLYTEDIRLRGWVGKKVFLDALNQAKSLLEVMKKMAKSLESNKSYCEGLQDANAKKTAKMHVKMSGEMIDLSGHLCRGICAASRKVGGSVWERFFTLES